MIFFFQVSRQPADRRFFKVTMYMVMQGIAPMVWGPVSDHVGRRPIFSGCLLILSLTCVGLALVPISAYWLLMLLRCLQAAGSASTIAIGAGVIGDIATREERGGFYGIYALGPMIGPSIGPVIGGALSQHLGWRSIFWFLSISSAGCLMIMLLFMPETLRTLVGDGSVPPSIIHRPIIPIIKTSGEPCFDSVPTTKTPRNPFLLLAHVDITILLGLNAIVCAVYYGFIATISTLFVVAYPHLSETEIGLCYLGIGGGMAIGSSLNGKMLDWEYGRISKQTGLATDLSQERDGKYPIENARLRLLPILVLLLVVCCAGYGWCIENKVNIAGPLILQFLVGYVAIAVMNSTQTLMVDLFPSQGASITACNNLVRCSLSAILVAVLDLILRSVGVAWTYVLLGGLSLLAIPLIYLEIMIGPACREKRRLK